MMTSGPAPVLAETAVCWVMSSQPTRSTLTSTPNSLANFAELARKITSSGSTNFAGRIRRRVAPFSIGRLGAATSALGMAWALAWPAAMIAAALAPSLSASRRLMMNAIVFSSLYSTLPGLEPPPRLLVEQMDQRGIGQDRQDLAGLGRDALPECADDRLAADPHQDLGLRTGRLDHLHGRRN